MTTFRCSSLGRLTACAASAIPPETRIEPPREASDAGLAFHDYMPAVIRGESPDIEAIAAQHNVEPEEIGWMCGWAAKTWRETLSPLFPNPHVEEQLDFLDTADDMMLTGRPDIWCVTDGEIRVLDWKTGWLDVDASAQLKGYGLLALYASQAQLPVRLTALRVRDQRADTIYWTPPMLDSWWNWLKRHLQDVDIYRTGEHCGRCPRALECSAHGEEMVTLSAMLCGETLPIGDMAETAAATVQNVRLLEKRCEQFRATVKAHVIAKGGSWGPLKIVETHPKVIDVARGQSVLIETLGVERLMPLLKVSKGDLEDAVKETAPPRGKGAAVKQLLERLDSVGAITTTTVQRLEVKRNGDSNSNTPAIEAGTGN